MLVIVSLSVLLHAITLWRGASAKQLLSRQLAAKLSQISMSAALLDEGVAGIGFDLSWSYGCVRHWTMFHIFNADFPSTASITYWNGSYADVAHIQGDEEYYELFKRLDMRSSEHLQ